MTQGYYIIEDQDVAGPYDLIMIMRKIRNGTLTPTTLIQMSENDASTTKIAHEWPELAEFFDDDADNWTISLDHGHLKNHSLRATLKSGWSFLQRNMITSLFSGIFVLVIISLLAAIYLVVPPVPVALRVFAYMAVFIFAHFLLSWYLLIILRMVRGQPADMRYLQKKLFPVLDQLLIFSTVVSIPAIIGLGILALGKTMVFYIAGMLILTIPGGFALATFAFVPLLITDQGYNLWDAMSASRKAVFKSGTENIGIIFALFVINFISGLLVLLPMAITLPVTAGSLAEIYDELFS